MIYKLVFPFLFLFFFCEIYYLNAQNILNPHTSNIVNSMEMVRQTPSPSSGVVKSNPPYLAWAAVVKEKIGGDTFKYDKNLFQVRLSKDKNFDTTDTIISEVLEWTFWNPHTLLDIGTWYWQYAIINERDGSKQWSESIEFVVSGNEEEFLTPSTKEFIKLIPKQHPRILASSELIGNMGFPKEMSDAFLIYCKSFIGKKLPKSLIFNNQKVIKAKRKELDAKKMTRLIARSTKEIYRDQFFETIDLIKAYLISGNEDYLNEALRRYEYLKVQFSQIQDKGYYNDFTEGMYLSISTLVYDVFYNKLDAVQRSELEKFLVKKQKETFKHYIHNVDLHLHGGSHLWQHHLRDFFTTSLALVHHVPEASKWVSYVYELWSMRAPIGSLNDGGWAMGNSYVGANTRSLITMPTLLSRYTGVNYFNRPWYKNTSKYFMYTSPIGHIAGGFGDNADIKSETMVSFVKAMQIINKNDVYAKKYSDLANKYGKKKSRKELSLFRDGNNLFWFAQQAASFLKDEKDLNENGKPNFRMAEDFRDIGLVAMHTDLEEPNKNLMVSFKSCPYGLLGHGHAAQNSFNIQYGGEPLFFRTGYYSSSSDHHSLQSYRHSRAHNTILADGMGQKFHSDGYGWVPRFLTGDKISYCLGDASNAYSGIEIRDAFKKYFKDWNIEISKENGFGNPGIKKFRRHLVFLRPDIIVLYDDLEADKPVEWDWLIHSKDTLRDDDGFVYTESKKGKGRLKLFSSSSFVQNITDQFYSPAIDWLGNGAKFGLDYKNHWHGNASTTKMRRNRFLAIIQVVDKDKGSFADIKQLGNGLLYINGWTISAELDPEKEPTLKLVDEKNLNGFNFGGESLILNGKKFNNQKKGSSLLVEFKNGVFVEKESLDILPNSMIYR